MMSHVPQLLPVHLDREHHLPLLKLQIDGLPPKIPRLPLEQLPLQLLLLGAPALLPMLLRAQPPLLLFLLRLRLRQQRHRQHHNRLRPALLQPPPSPLKAEAKFKLTIRRSLLPPTWRSFRLRLVLPCQLLQLGVQRPNLKPPQVKNEFHLPLFCFLTFLSVGHFDTLSRPNSCHKHASGNSKRRSGAPLPPRQHSPALPSDRCCEL